MSIEDLEGGPALCAWFGGRPSFHDATLQRLSLQQNGPSRFVARTFRMTSDLDDGGYFVLTHHVVVTLTLYGLVRVELREFTEAAIMTSLDIAATADGVKLAFESSYGVCGEIEAKRIVVAFEPVAA